MRREWKYVAEIVESNQIWRVKQGEERVAKEGDWEVWGYRE